MGKDNERQWIHGLASILFSLVLLIATSGFSYRDSLSGMVNSFLYYPELPVHILRQGIVSLEGWLHTKDQIIEEIRNLNLENMRLRTAIRYEKTMDFANSLSSNRSEALVIYRPPAHWWSEIRIDKGSEDGVTVGLGVLQKGYLVGRVAAVERNCSWVELVTSQTQMIPIVVEETRDLGVAIGDGRGGVWVLYLPDNKPFRTGMVITTAMVSELLIPGIPIGRISTERTAMLGGVKAYWLELEADLAGLYGVSVLKVRKGG